MVFHFSSIMMVSMYESKVADAIDFPLSDKSASDVRRMSFDVLNPCSSTSQDTIALAFILRSLRALPNSLFSLIFIVFSLFVVNCLHSKALSTQKRRRAKLEVN